MCSVWDEICAQAGHPQLSPSPCLVSCHFCVEGLRLCLCVCVHQLSPAPNSLALRSAFPLSAVGLGEGAKAEGRQARSPPQPGPGPGCHQGPASAFLQASAKPEPQLHVNTSCVKTAQLLLGQQTAVELLGNCLAPPIRPPPTACTCKPSAGSLHPRVLPCPSMPIKTVGLRG